jgi:hypothetical protein
MIPFPQIDKAVICKCIDALAAVLCVLCMAALALLVACGLVMK